MQKIFNRFLLIGLIFLFACGGPTAPMPSFLHQINSIDNKEARQLAVAQLIDSLSGMKLPLIQGDSVFYLLNRKANKVRLAGDLTSWNPGTIQFGNLKGTDLWYYAHQLERNAFVEYKFVINDGEWILDPLNPDSTEGEYINSIVKMPEYVHPVETDYYPEIPHGRIDSFSIKGKVLEKERSYFVYLPPTYDQDTSTHFPVAYFHDGSGYINRAKANNILDYLICKKQIRPIIAVFIDPVDRSEEYAFAKQQAFIDFMINEMVPLIDDQYRTIAEAEARGTFGASFGGLISAKIAFGHPEVFGLCGAHSASYWVNKEGERDYVIDRLNSKVEYGAVWGTYEPGIMKNNREVRDAFQAVGKELFWKELPAGHSWNLWKQTTADFMRYFFPPLLDT